MIESEYTWIMKLQIMFTVFKTPHNDLYEETRLVFKCTLTSVCMIIIEVHVYFM